MHFSSYLLHQRFIIMGSALPAWLVGLRRALRARETEEVGYYALEKGYMGQLGQVVSIHSLRLASLI